MWDFRHRNGGTDGLLWTLEYHVTAHTELRMTCRKMFTDYCMARAITASPCFWQFDGNWLKWISKFLEQSFRRRCLPHTRQGCNKNEELLLSSAFIFFLPETALQMRQADVLSSSLSSFCRIMKPTSQSQHCSQVISHLFPPHLKETTACLTPPVLYFPHPKFDETCPNKGKGAVRLCCQRYRVGFKNETFLFIVSILKEENLLYPILLQQKKNNCITTYSKNSIILAGYFDREVWHSQHPPPTVFLMLHPCVDKQSPVTTSLTRVSRCD